MFNTRITLAVVGVLFIGSQARAQAPQPTESARPKPIVIARPFPDNGGVLQNYHPHQSGRR